MVYGYVTTLDHKYYELPWGICMDMCYTEDVPASYEMWATTCVTTTTLWMMEYYSYGYVGTWMLYEEIYKIQQLPWGIYNGTYYKEHNTLELQLPYDHYSLYCLPYGYVS